jgi:very-short-patch-repair endonuclease
MPAVLCGTERHVPGVLTSRTRKQLSEEEVTIVSGIPVTSVARTLVDLAPLLPLDDLARACHEANVLHKMMPTMVEPLLAGRPGAARLRRTLTGDEAVTLSRLEKRFLAGVRAAGLPMPVTNKQAGSKSVDCRWPAHRLTVELDSYAFHNTRYAWEQDRKREREAYARGDAFRRYTWNDVTRAPAQMLRELSALLS